MSRILHSTRVKINGPWLLEKDAITELDEIIQTEWDQLETEREKRLKNDADEHIRESYGEIENEEEYQAKLEEYIESSKRYELRHSKKIIIRLSDERYIKLDSFKEAFKNDSLINEKPTGFRFTLESGGIDCDIDLNSSFNHLDINVRSGTNKARELFTTLHHWAENHKPPKWQQIWSEIKGFHWFFAFILIFIYSSVVQITQDTSKLLLEQNSVQLIEEGIDSTNIYESVEILLRYQAEHYPEVEASTGSNSIVIVTIFILVASILLSFLPKSIIAIGKGNQSINRWKRWINFVGITLPASILSYFVLPELVKIFREAFL